MSEIARQLAAAASVVEISEILSAAGPADLAELGDLARQAQPAPYAIPGPYDIAMAFGAAALATGKYDSPGAAMTAAWMAVPEFYMARDSYLRDMAPMFFPAAPPEGSTVAAESDA